MMTSGGGKRDSRFEFCNSCIYWIAGSSLIVEKIELRFCMLVEKARCAYDLKCEMVKTLTANA